MTAGPGRAARQAGFTLLEILVALTVLGLLLVGLTHGVGLGLGLWHAQTTRIAKTGDLDAVERSLRRILSDLPNQSAIGALRRGGPAAMTGSADQVRFVGKLPTGFGTTRRAKITLELHGRSLVLRWVSYLHAVRLGPAPEPVDTDLVDGVERLELAYWRSAGPNRPAAWQTKWDGPGLPELIRVRLVFIKGERGDWPDLIVAPRQ